MRVLDIARGELGVQESPKNSNNVKYNTWYYGREVHDGLWNTSFPWCMAFVQWCFMTAGAPLPYKTASCSGLLNWYKAHKPQLVSDTPHAGDIVIYNFGHTGIVESIGDGTITAIEGNTGNSSQNNGGEVMRKTRKLSAVEAFITAFEEKEEEPMRYNTVEELPKSYRDGAKKLIERGALRGKDGGKLDITEDMIRTLIICQRMVDGED